MKKNIYLVLIVFILSFSFAKAELSGTVFGIDSDGKKAALPKATVQWLNTGIGTLTDSKGRFNIETTDKTNKLVVSYIGYKKDTIQISKNQKNLEIKLKSELELDEIEIVGHQAGNTVSYSSIAKTESITSHGLKKAACCNLSESFQTNPSVDVEYSDAMSGAKQIQLLGLQGKYVQMLTDKMPNLRGIASMFGLSYVPGPWMESIQISKGAASVVEGYESISGQINVSFKKNASAEDFYSNIYTNQQGKIEGNINTKIPITDNIRTILFLHGNTLQIEDDHNNDGFLDHPLVTQFNFFNHWEYAGDNIHSQLGFKALYEDREAGQKGFFPSKKPNLYGLNIKTERYEVFAKNGYVLPTEQYSSIALIASASHHKQDSYFGLNTYNGKQNSVFVNLLYDWKIEKLHHHDEEESEEEHHHETEKEISHHFVNGVSLVYDEFIEEFKGTDYYRNEIVPGVYTEYTLSNVFGFTFTAGARADFHNIHGTFFTPRFHLKYDLSENIILRASAGKGFRTSNIFSENIGSLASSRNFVVEESLKPEEAVNYGINANIKFDLFGTEFTLNSEYYRTDFINQIVVDMDRSPRNVYFSNLHGDSYSNSFQTDLSFTLFEGMDVMAAYRLNDVKTTFNGVLLEKPLISKHKAFLNLAYSTLFREWMADFTIDFNGGGRLPNTSSNPEEYRLPEKFDSFVLLHAQITKTFDNFEIYIGAENLTGYTQPVPVLGYNNPFGEYFDSSIVYAPITGRNIYLGLRWKI